MNKKPRYQWIDNTRWNYFSKGRKNYDIIDTKNGIIIESHNSAFEVRKLLDELNNRITIQIKHASNPYDMVMNFFTKM